MHGKENKWLDRFKEDVIGVYDRLPPRVLSLLEPAKVLVRQAVAFVSELFLPIMELTIEPIGGSQPVTVLFVGRMASLDIVLRLLAPRRYNFQRLAYLPFWKIRRHLSARSGQYDLLVVAVNPILYRHLKQLGFWQFPEGLRSVLKLKDTFEETLATFQKKTRKAISRFRGDEFTWHVSKDMLSLRKFYYDSYVPYAKQKYGEHAIILSYYMVQRLFRTGFLLTVQKAGKPLAAGICRIRNQTFVSELIGIPGGRMELLAERASPLLDYYSVAYAVENKCRHLDFGLSSPYLDNGVVRHKRKWGTTLVGRQKANRVIGFGFGAFDSARLAVFGGSYPVFIEDTGLVGLVVLKTTDRVDVNTLKKIEKAYYHRGLKKMIIVSPPGFEDAALQYVERHLKNSVRTVGGI